MRLLLNATNLRSEGGVILLTQLLGALLQDENHENLSDGLRVSQLLLYHNPELTPRIRDMVEALPPEVQKKVELTPLREPDGLRRFYWEQVTLPAIIRQQQVDTLLSFGNTGPLFPGCRQILYLQQSIPYSTYRPTRHGWKWRKFQCLYGFLINLAQLGSQRIIVPTGWLVEPMRQAIGYRKPPDAYRVSLPGLPPWPSPENYPLPEVEQALLQHLSLARTTGEKILLYPCYLAPYKNIPALLEAIQQVPDTSLPFKLVLTFHESSKEYFPCQEEVLQAVSRCDPNRILLVGALSRPLLAQVYQHTDILIFPSLVETLGLPLLEAMSQGIPIIALDGALPDTQGGRLNGAAEDTPPNPHLAARHTLAAFAREICRDAALYAPPGNPQALAETIHRLLSDPSLAESLSQNGLKRASQLSWGRHAKDILSP